MKRNTLAAIALLVLVAFGGLVLIYPMMFNPVIDTAPASLPEPKVPPMNPPTPHMTK